jgi:hypothetical protein
MDVALVFMANADGAHFSKSVVVGIETLGAAPQPMQLPDLVPDAATLAACAGTYLDPFNAGDILVTIDGAALSVEMPAIDAANIPYDPLLTSIDPRNWVMSIQGTQLLVTFVDDETGTPRWFRTRAFVGTRSDGMPMPSPPPPVRGVDPDAFRAAIHHARTDGRLTDPARFARSSR